MSRAQTLPVIAVTGVIGGRDSRDVKARLHTVADRLRRLAPSHRDPEAFHVEKAELVEELRRLAQRAA